ncbi:MAG TPA: d(CMP) kinase [Verrucomicrobiae bacterium]|jgi:cytidylate kinase|nr:d(CMP) kinase [Verrucomicrobiae bacterium]
MAGGTKSGGPIVIAVDGPAASGKGTLARRLAAHYGLHHLDTGLLYRAVGLRAQREGMDPVAAAEALTLADLAEPALREDSAAQAASKVAVIPAVREALRELQRRFAAEPPGAVLDGRDIGTVVFPEAPIKIYVDATPEARARRRHEELREMGLASIYSRVLQDMRERDARDRGRAVAPLTLAKDALVIDSSELDADQVFARALAYIGHILPGLVPG